MTQTDVITKPQMTPYDNGKLFKTLKVTAKAGMKMPSHHATSEAVIVVHKGEALLKISNETHRLTAGSSFTIPKKKEHSLEVLKDFEAFAIMTNDTDIQFPE